MVGSALLACTLMLCLGKMCLLLAIVGRCVEPALNSRGVEKDMFGGVQLTMRALRYNNGMWFGGKS